MNVVMIDYDESFMFYASELLLFYSFHMYWYKNDEKWQIFMIYVIRLLALL